MDNDLLTGAQAIADFLGWSRRRLYHHAEKASLPIFRLEGTLCARKSALTEHFAKLEREALEAARAACHAGSANAPFHVDRAKVSSSSGAYAKSK